MLTGILLGLWIQRTDQPGRTVPNALVHAKAAQASFERGRRQLLPVTGGGGGRCDARIGRFCYWYDDADTTLPAEPAAVRRERERLLASLERGHEAVPGNDWIWGQRIRYLVDHDLADSAARLLKACDATRWWCLALAGLGHHAAGAYRASEAAFNESLAAMPPATRCEWSDWKALVGDSRLGGTDLVRCDQRWATIDTLLWLGQPLLSNAGNDLRTELFSRRTMATIQAAAVPPHLVAWGRDLEELMLRYGWSKRWSVSSYPTSSLEPPSLVGHDRPPAYWFLPTRGDSLLPWRWRLDADRPQSRYAPPYARLVVATDQARFALFPRGDSTLVVAGFGPGAWPRVPGPFRLAVAASNGPDAPTATAHLDHSSLTTPLILRIAGQPRLLGLEAIGDSARRFLRAREFRSPPAATALTLSDLLLFSVDQSLPGSLEDAVARAVDGRRLSRRTPVGVYWEWSGSPTDSVEVAITTVPVRRGVLGRVAQGLALKKRRLPLSLQWSAGAATATPESRTIELDFSRLSPGAYRLRLTATSGPHHVVRELPIELEP